MIISLLSGILTAHGGRSGAIHGHEAHRPAADVVLSEFRRRRRVQGARNERAVVAGHHHSVGAVAAAGSLGGPA